MNFQESLNYLYGLGNEVTAMKLGLENIAKLLTALGTPQKKFTKIQVAGTNGKGSTCAFLDAICVSAGIKTGLYTSPHLVSITERIKIGGTEISETDFARHATIIKETAEKLVAAGELETVPTFFEQITAIALCAFAEAKIELAILETGLGGRFDATTAANAEIVAITPIDYDHQDILGATLTEIAAEKAAIIRKDTKVIIASQKEEVTAVLLNRCAETAVQPIIDEIKFDVDFVNKKNGTIVATFISKKEIYKTAELSLAGRHQIENAKLAVGLAEILKKDFDFKISKFDVVKGLENACHKGRLEFKGDFLFDGAHNIGGAKALKEFLDEFIKQPLTIVFGAMRDKDLTEIAEILFPKATSLILTKPDNPRSLETEDLMKFVPSGFTGKNVYQIESVETALKKAIEISAGRNLICVTGSLYLVGEAQKILADSKLIPIFD